MRIVALIVDDETAVRNGVTRHLLKAAARHQDILEISQAKTATGALKLSKGRDFDFAIIDYDLGGGLSGIQLAVRLIEKFSYLFVCLFSAKDTAVVESALHAAVEDKPFTIQYREKPVS